MGLFNEELKTVEIEPLCFKYTSYEDTIFDRIVYLHNVIENRNRYKNVPDESELRRELIELVKLYIELISEKGEQKRYVNDILVTAARTLPPNMIRNAMGLKEINKPEKLCTIKITRDEISEILAKHIEEQGYHVNPEGIQFHLNSRLDGKEYEIYFDSAIAKCKEE